MGSGENRGALWNERVNPTDWEPRLAQPTPAE
jgi:hypothetical protein